jgi:hypothetical protein
MSYARFGWDNSDVYVYMSVSGFLECCGCLLVPLKDEFDAPVFYGRSTQEMIDHLKRHEEAGENVPQDIYESLWEDDKENFGVVNEI